MSDLVLEFIRLADTKPMLQQRVVVNRQAYADAKEDLAQGEELDKLIVSYDSELATLKRMLFIVIHRLDTIARLVDSQYI